MSISTHTQMRSPLPPQHSDPLQLTKQMKILMILAQFILDQSHQSQSQFNKRKLRSKKTNPMQSNPIAGSPRIKKVQLNGVSPKDLFIARMQRPNKYRDKDKESTKTKQMPFFIAHYNASYPYDSKATHDSKIKNMTITLNANTVNMIVPHGYRYIWLQNNNKLKFCNGVPTRLGNVLSGYWTARSLAYFLGIQFELIDPHKYTKQRCVNHLSNERVKRMARYFYDETYVVKYRQSLKDNKDTAIYDGVYWTRYLDKVVTNQSIIHDYAHVLDEAMYLEIVEWVYSVIKHVKFEDLSISEGFETKQLTYLSDFRLVWENPLYFDHVLVPAIHNAFNEYMMFIYNKTSSQIRNEIFTSDKDIVLHYRCGDIALVSNLKRHGFLSMSFYKQALDESGWNTYLLNGTDMTVWIVTQENNYKCVQIVSAAMPFFIELFKPAKVEIVKHESVFGMDGTKALNMDFFRMANAPLLICSTSTFCDQAAIANKNKVMFPSIGCWIGWYKNKQHWHPKHHRYIHVDNNTLLLNPGRFNVQHIIDFVLNN
eukprot:381336_1